MPAPTDQDTDDTLDTTDATSGGSADVTPGAGDGEGEASESSGSASSEGGESGEGTAADDELLITLEGDSAANDGQQQEEATAPQWVRDLRKESRAKDRRIRELERAVGSTQQAAPVSAGPKPTLESCNFDSGKFEADLATWMERDVEVKRAAADQRKQQESMQQAYVKRLGDVESAAKALRIAGVDEAKESFEGGLTPIQQAIVMNGPEDVKTSAMLRHVIGANPAVAKRLAAIQDPVKFAFATAELVQKMKTTSRKNAPPPERRLSSGAVGTSAVDDALEAARKRADKSGDRTEVARLMRQRAQRAA